MVSNKSLEVNAALAESTKQATFEKEAQTPSGTGTPASPRRPNGQPAETQAEQNGSGETPQRSSPTSSAQPNGNQRDFEGQKAVNKVMLAGRLGRDAEVRHTKGGLIVANFSLGTEESYKDRLGEWQKKTAWHRVQVWGDVAETVSANLRQGARVYVEGKLIIRNWIDKQNNKHRSTEVVASDVRFLTLASSNGAQSGSEFADEHTGD
ncbi:MAG TPA: single-stranded DNA-binding protein [Candidatus Acidoferrum sp.]